MVLSFLILLLSLNADVGAMPSWAMAALALVAIASLAILARARHQDA
jgi:inner membrane protein involved in colicin E2 resistance